jgi:cytochrome c oxidase subunit 2
VRPLPGAWRLASAVRAPANALASRLQLPLPLLATVAACDGPLSILDPAGPAARDAALLWWPMLLVAVLSLLLVSVLWLLALRRGPRGDEAEAKIVRRWLVGGGLLLPTVSLIALLAFGIPAGERMLLPGEPPPLRIEVTARQWAWEVRYPASGVVMVNRLHLPLGQPVEIHLESADVIHSFWVPRLGRKLDVIPGRRNVLRLQADHLGRLQGQCAEYCGRGHAHMRLAVEVHSGADFAAWLDRQAAATVVARR